MKKFEEINKNNGQYSFEQVSREYGILQNRNQIRPGRFYSLKTVSPVPNLTEAVIPSISYGKDYYDLSPVGLLLFHEKWSDVPIILNLRVIPPTVCAKLLEAYYYISSQNGLDTLFKEGKLIPLEERQLIDKKFYLITTTILSQLIGLNNLNYAINKYNVDDIAEARLIDWDNFGMLVQPKQSAIGIFPDPLNLVRVFEKFISNSI